jgi:hypothetical protein
MKLVAGDEPMPSKSLRLFDASTLFLLFANLMTGVVAIYEQWRWAEVLWSYWGQSVVICYFGLRKISSQHPSPRTGVVARRFELGFYAFCYGLPLALYAFFLGFASANLTRQDLYGLLVCVAVFAGNHYFSFKRNLAKDLARQPTEAALFLFPFARILPMHLTFAFGLAFATQSTGMLILFLGFKTVVDVFLHKVEHRAERPA